MLVACLTRLVLVLVIVIGWFFPIYSHVDVMEGDKNDASPKNDSRDHAGNRRLP